MELKANEHEGTVTQIHGNNGYRVRFDLEGKKLELLCYLSGNMKRFRIKVVLGDTVKAVLLPPFDRGRIVFRER